MKAHTTMMIARPERFRCHLHFKTDRVPADTSVDAHHAGNASRDRTNAPGASGSIDAHHAADDITDTTLALMSYNIGI